MSIGGMVVGLGLGMILTWIFILVDGDRLARARENIIDLQDRVEWLEAHYLHEPDETVL